jgi:hypothetical protein
MENGEEVLQQTDMQESGKDKASSSETDTADHEEKHSSGGDAEDSDPNDEGVSQQFVEDESSLQLEVDNPENPFDSEDENQLVLVADGHLSGGRMRRGNADPRSRDCNREYLSSSRWPPAEEEFPEDEETKEDILEEEESEDWQQRHNRFALYTWLPPPQDHTPEDVKAATRKSELVWEIGREQSELKGTGKDLRKTKYLIGTLRTMQIKARNKYIELRPGVEPFQEYRARDTEEEPDGASMAEIIYDQEQLFLALQWIIFRYAEIRLVEELGKEAELRPKVAELKHSILTKKLEFFSLKVPARDPDQFLGF